MDKNKEYEFKVGQIVYLAPGVNVARYNKELREGVVEKIGRKYVYVSIDNYQGYKFNKKTLEQFTSYITDYYLFLSKQQYLDEVEKREIDNWFSEMFRYRRSSFTIDQLRRMSEIAK